MHENESMVRNTKYVMWTGTAVFALLVTAFSFLFLSEFYASKDNRKWVVHTYEVLIAAHGLEKSMVDMETGQRGFIVTGKDNFLEPFSESIATIFNDIKHLQKKVRDNPQQIERLDTLDKQIKEWLEIAGNPEIEARKQYDLGVISFEDVSALLIKETGKQQFDLIRSTLADFIALEEALTITRKQKTSSDIETIQITLISGVLLIILCSLLAGGFMRILDTFGKRIGLGFFMMALILATTIFITLYQVKGISQINRDIRDLRTPAAEASLQLLNGVNHSLVALRGWILLGEERFKSERQLAWEEEILPSIEIIETLARAWINPNDVVRLNNIQKLLQKFQSYQENIEAVAQTKDNKPASKILFEEAAPQAKIIADNITVMIDLEKTYVKDVGDIGESRTILLANMADFRGSLVLGQANLQAYLMSDENRFKLKFQKNWDVNTQAFEMLAAKETLLNAQQRKAFENIVAARTAFGNLPGKIFDLHGSAKWNLANYELATYAVPLAFEIKDFVGAIHQNQKQLRDSDFIANQAQIVFLDISAWVLLVMGIMLSGAMGVVITRTTVKPMKNAINVANEVAGGNLDINVHISGSKETKELGIALEKMVTQIKERAEALANSEERANGIINGSVDTIITIDQRGTVLSFNLAGEQLFGYSAEEVIDQNVKLLIPGLYHSEHDGFLDNYRNTGEKKIIGNGREVEAKKRDGTLFPIDLAVSEVNIVGQKFYSGIIRDITERKVAEEGLQQANIELEEFAYRTSHDLRSPIISSVSLLDMALTSIHDKKPDVAVTCLSHVQNSLTKLNALITDILVLTEAKNRDEDDQEINMTALVNEALKRMEHMEGFERLDMQTDFRFDGKLCAKEMRVNMILENLISNAIKYQDPEKDRPYVKISTYHENGNFMLEIKDNGRGIPKDQQGNLFTMFKRFHPKVAFGSGLGLYLMKKSADVLNGEISFEDHDEGSIFRLKIPV